MEQVNPNISKLKLSRSTLFIYGLGDFASNLCWTFIGSYLTVFYTDIVGIAPALASILILIARVFDGVWDPTFGAIAERTNTRLGRFRPYIFWGSPFLALFAVLSFVKFGSGTIAIILAFITYFICGLLFTVVNLSYGSLSTVMTTDQDDLAQLTSYRMMGTNLSSVLITSLTPILLGLFSKGNSPDARGYLITALVFALAAIPMFILVGIKCHENIRPVNQQQRIKIKLSMQTVLKNRPLMLLFSIMFLGMLAMFGRVGTLIYYVMYDVKRFDLTSLFMTLPSLGGIVGIFLTKSWVTKIGRKKMCTIGYLGCGLSLLAMFVVGQAGNYRSVWALIIIDFIYGLFNFVMPIPMAMVADAINFGEYKFGVRSDGLSYAAVSLSVKLGSAFGASIGLAIMAITGYAANQVQSPTAQFGINSVVNLLYGFLWIACLVPLYFYPLNEKINNKINTKLAERREKVNLSVVNLSSSKVNGNLAKLSNNTSKKWKHEYVEEIYAMANGKVISLNEVNDSATASGILGKGFAIEPTDGRVVAPVAGVIINIFTSKHAIGLRTKNGLELLIHMGIDTFDMAGKPFTILVGVGQHVEPGEPIAIVDLNQIGKAKKGKEILFIVTNQMITKRIIFDKLSKVLAGDSIGHIVI